MSDPQTPNKGLFQPARGSDSGTWDIPTNANTTTLDSILGGVQSIAITTADISLTQTQANNLIFTVTGALTGNRNLIFPAIGGLFIIENKTTGAYTLNVETSAGEAPASLFRRMRPRSHADANRAFHDSCAEKYH